MLAIKPVLLVAAPFFLALGLVLPLVQFEKLYFFTETPSLIDIVAGLWQSGDRALACLVCLLSIIFPAIKMVGIAAEGLPPVDGVRGGALLSRLIPLLSKWSMMDVMLVAIVIVAAKSSGLANAFTQPGLWFYAASALFAGLLHSTSGQKLGRN